MNDDRFNDDMENFDDGSDLSDNAGATTTFASDDLSDDDVAIGLFTQRVDEKILILRDRNAKNKERCAAAYWLGESGEARAIADLVKVYKKEKKNKDLYQAATYALGQFKALDQAIKRGPKESVFDAINKEENALIGEHLINIALNGGGARRSRISARALYLLMGLLVITLLFMLAILLTPSGSGAERRYDEKFATLTGLPEQIAVQQARILTDDLKADVQALNRQASDTALDCELAFNEPIQFAPEQAVTDVLPVLSEYAMQYNQQRAQFFAAKTDYDSACSVGTTLSTATRGTLNEKLAALNQALVTLENDLIALEIAAQQLAADSDTRATATTQAAFTATALASLTPTLTPTPTVTPGAPLEQINRQIGLIASTIGDARGGLDLLGGYWTNTEQSGGNTQDCISVPPIFPENYVLPEEMLPFVGELKTVVDLLNAGLEFSRASYSTFQQGCAASNMGAVLALGQQTIETARVSLDQAQIELDAYTAKVRQQP